MEVADNSTAIVQCLGLAAEFLNLAFSFGEPTVSLSFLMQAYHLQVGHYIPF